MLSDGRQWHLLQWRYFFLTPSSSNTLVQYVVRCPSQESRGHGRCFPVLLTPFIAYEIPSLVGNAYGHAWTYFRSALPLPFAEVLLGSLGARWLSPIRS